MCPPSCPLSRQAKCLDGTVLKLVSGHSKSEQTCLQGIVGHQKGKLICHVFPKLLFSAVHIANCCPSSISVVDIGIPLCSLVLSTLIFSIIKSDVQIENRGISEKKKNYLMFYTLKSNPCTCLSHRVLLPPEWCPKALQAHTVWSHSLYTMSQQVTKVLQKYFVL